MKPASKIILWAVYIKGYRSEWIHWDTIACTRKQAWEKYVSFWTERKYPDEERRKKKCRLATVVVSPPP